MIITNSLPRQKRLLVIASAFFFLASAYLCFTRLFSMSFTRSNRHGHGSPSIILKGNRHRPKLNHADLPMSYGDYERPAIEGLTLTSELPRELVPTFENGRRLIIIGDIHGMSTELDELIKEVSFNEKTDHIIATGDMISKGPDSPGVVSRLMDLKASAVRGNHEDRVLLAHASVEAQYGVAAEIEESDTQSRRGQLEYLAVARDLTTDHIKWLSDLPVILTAEPLPIYIVHAGLVPGVPVHKQDPWAVMNMRSLLYPREKYRAKEGEDPRRLLRRDEPDLLSTLEKEVVGGEEEDKENKEETIKDSPVFTMSEKPSGDKDSNNDETSEAESSEEHEAVYHDDADDPDYQDGDDPSQSVAGVSFDRQVAIPIEARKGEKWYLGWNNHQLRQPRRARRTVIYGHDARGGYKEEKYTVGLDSGCVKGAALTALIVEATEGGGFKHTTTQVKCEHPDAKLN